MMVDPKAKLPGSTSVACWLVEFVNVSVLSLISGTVAGGKVEPPGPPPEVDFELEPQLRIATIAKAAESQPATDLKLNGNLFRGMLNNRLQKLPACVRSSQCKFECSGLLT